MSLQAEQVYVPRYYGSVAEQEELALRGWTPPPATDAAERMANLAKQVSLKEQKLALMHGLPHRYAWKWYPWAKDFFESRNKQNFLCAANQISKSSTQIRKCIEWATNTDLWPQLWDRSPNLFWYLYPDKTVATAEFEIKWIREFMPRAEFKNHERYGWEEHYDRGKIDYVEFNTGVRIYFKSYNQDVQNLQTGTVYAIFCDEELPEDLYGELDARLNASGGYFSMVFTATLGQDFWRRCMEPDEGEEEVFPTAYKQTVSLYDAMFYEDGTPSHWTSEKISFVKAKCKSEQDIQKRVYGKFIVLDGRKYPTFNSLQHVKPWHHVPPSWSVYHGADPGSGGANGHPAALCYLAVSPDRRQGRVFLGWRGDKIETTNDYVVRKHIELKKEHNLSPIAQYYDWANKDFEMTARGLDEHYLKAEKSHEVGEGILNTLFKNNMLFIYDEPTGELAKLARELSTLKEKTLKKHAKDNLTDALRYAASKVDWDFSGIIDKPSEYVEPPVEEADPDGLKAQMRARRGIDEHEKEENSIEDELEEWNSHYEGA
jgi:phage terminase large subunit-like protein